MKNNSRPEENTHKPVTELARDMSLMHVTMIGVGAMIGAGIFVLTGIAAGVAGPALILVFLLNGFVTGLTAMSYAELGSCFPEAGGGYLWVKEALPQPNGFLSGWVSWFAHAVACSLYAVAFGAFSVDLLSVAGVNVSRLVSPLGIHDEPVVLAAKLIAVCITLLFVSRSSSSGSSSASAFTPSSPGKSSSPGKVSSAVFFKRGRSALSSPWG
jgi:amino acid transporter